MNLFLGKYLLRKEKLVILIVKEQNLDCVENGLLGLQQRFRFKMGYVFQGLRLNC
jgi:hypothetical protein